MSFLGAVVTTTLKGDLPCSGWLREQPQLLLYWVEFLLHELSPLTWVNLTDIRKPSIGTTRVAYSLPLHPKQTAPFVKLNHFSVKRLNKLNQFDVNGVGDLVEIDPIIFHL